MVCANQMQLVVICDAWTWFVKTRTGVWYEYEENLLCVKKQMQFSECVTVLSSEYCNACNAA